MKPIIGITMTVIKEKYNINVPYVQSVLEAGGLPFCIPFGVEKDAAQVVEVIDGLLLTGGVDVHPHYFQEEPHPQLGEVMLERDKVEIALAHAALNKKLPIFAICRGIQLLNVALGGTLYQDINAQYEQEPLLHKQQALRHEPSHFVDVVQGSILHKIVGKDRIAVNSLHHQAVKDVSDILKVSSRASDGIIEAMELENYPFCIAVQWHPEEMAVKGDTHSRELFRAFIEACGGTGENVK
ncbi:gamma-glutamyl-gamma-aminobutyrate hydrolase family protein [Lysinibacillus sp. BW-2-10]|uniref:gamma-glutamyl-gamma-aminobutyrate hydrolase family protein n=1 Tax=Lysinibacillus sp. BW-2-10 TaxID=2590030 RepID=UPI00117D5187|nr:gamma-glutamyl-gamma-aminobutyrate hydrolase family protein [Lysinibacillus sp. BW-2-10]TSI10124.1 gamma-glutamyl-gamma-aminobutyrate hydrolase family protein [Lysinibacillus sp. BW-2-10]